jgi:hypothetical protein
MKQILTEAAWVFAILQLCFGYIEYRYKPDIIYIGGRLLTSSKYLIPSITLPVAYAILRFIMSLFAGG